MKVRMRVQVSGTRNGRPWPKAGEVADVPDAEGEGLLAAGLADRVDEHPESQPLEENAKAADGDVEKRPAPKGGGRGGRARRSDG